jgi:hypothetical protein
MKPYLMKVFSLMLVTIFLSGCDKSFLGNFFGKNEELTFVKTEYPGNELKINGYYYCRQSGNGTFSFDVQFFYIDGVLLSEKFTSDYKDLSAIENEVKSERFKKFIKKKQNVWGLYLINSTEIYCEKLYFGPFQAYIDSGKIINDSTFVILKRKSSYRTDEIAMQDTFHLKRFSPKPDSLNIYLK